MYYFTVILLVHIFTLFNCKSWTFLNESGVIVETHNKLPYLFDDIPYPPEGVIPMLNRKVFRGRRVSIREQPYMASIRRNVAHYSVGTILTENLVLTVAYPLINVSIAELSVVVGENYADRGSVLLTVILVIVHESFNSSSLEHDIALLQIYEHISYKSSAKSISLMNNTRSLEGLQAFVSGWGRCDRTGRELCLPRSTRYTRGEKFDPMLRTVSLYLKENETNCETYTRNGLHIGPGMLCQGRARVYDAVSACLAVPGAPLVVRGFLIGILSWGFGCGHSSDLPLIYTNCLFYREWIINNIMTLHAIPKAYLMKLFKAKRAYVLTEWFKLTRAVTLDTFRHIDRDMEVLRIDRDLARLSGTVYDIRDYLYNGIHHEYKLRMYKKLRENFIEDIKTKKYAADVQAMFRKRNEALRPFLENFNENKNLKTML